MRYSNAVYHALKNSLDFRKRQVYAFADESPFTNTPYPLEDGNDDALTAETREMALYG